MRPKGRKRNLEKEGKEQKYVEGNSQSMMRFSSYEDEPRSYDAGLSIEK
jgi:hypothetical protein